MTEPNQPNQPNQPADIHSVVREHYGKTAAEFKPKSRASCCGPIDTSCCGEATDGLSASQLYPASELETLPEEVTGLSLGCGDPITLAALQAGQTVLDLGSGGGIDCFMAARKVGESGQVIGVDMTPQMLEKARANQLRMGFRNVEFRLGEIEHLPVADNSVDVIISNCVVNLSPDKPQVFREAFRVLRSGGKLALSDIVTDGPLPQEIKDSLSAWAGCVAGALDVKDYLAQIEAAGFTRVDITPVYFDDATLDEFVREIPSGTDGSSGKRLLIQDGGETRVIELGESFDLPLKKSIFSAKISAYKP